MSVCCRCHRSHRSSNIIPFSSIPDSKRTCLGILTYFSHYRLLEHKPSNCTFVGLLLFSECLWLWAARNQRFIVNLSELNRYDTNNHIKICFFFILELLFVLLIFFVSLSSAELAAVIFSASCRAVTPQQTYLASRLVPVST